MRVVEAGRYELGAVEEEQVVVRLGQRLRVGRVGDLLAEDDVYLSAMLAKGGNVVVSPTVRVRA